MFHITSLVKQLLWEHAEAQDISAYFLRHTEETTKWRKPMRTLSLERWKYIMKMQQLGMTNKG